jgi:hypothetical protein
MNALKIQASRSSVGFKQIKTEKKTEDSEMQLQAQNWGCNIRFTQTTNYLGYYFVPQETTS